ncbi:flagellar motor switch protein FliG [Providencia rettgeri]
MSLSGTEKSAVMLMTLGEDQAAEVFKHLNPKEVQQLSMAVSNMRQISNNELAEVLTEFEESAIQFAALNINTNDYLRSVLIKALGEERAASLLEDIFEKQETTSGIESLNYMEPQTVADIIRDEHPQIIATILVHLKRNLAADVLELFEERQRNDIMLRIATFGGVQPAALAQLTEVLNNLLDGQNLKRSKMGGVRTAAEIINLMKSQQEESVIDAMRDYDGELAQRIIDEMFLFENLIEVDNRSIQRILQDVSTDYRWLLPSKAATKLYATTSSTIWPLVQRKSYATIWESRSPVRMSQVENEQKAILLIVRRLVEKGEIAIGGGDDVYVEVNNSK